ncbi:hypothetical protein [Alcaligenes faecalis]|uniref:hypothetical protein n=1 Tax=Alcaligenes faecalis TaxID=511 RepID=UPI001C82E44C|nr:hypothetical protein [Alcaligenes faecalis]MBX6966132.1 hypothetical protein [Providencia rettgeri]MBX7031065.1 hypothetical protein [Alcaligenes faecalis]
MQRALNNTSTEMLPWELELVAREIILNGDLLPMALASRKAFTPWKAVELLRELTMKISKEHVNSYDDALTAVAPLIHQQMPWSDDTFSRIARYGQIYRHEPLAKIIQSDLKMPLSAWLKLGLTVFSYLDIDSSAPRSIFFHVPGLDRQTVDHFFALTARSIEDLRLQTKAQQVYDQQWAYTFNPLRKSPINFFMATPERIFLPVPQLLIWRVTDGIYYDLIETAGKPFAKAFGDACEIYVGNVLKVALSGLEVEIHGERRYDSSKGEKAGADWLVSDHSGHVFLECKAKRLTLPAKMAGFGESMDRDLNVLAGYIVQNYKNIRDAMQGYVSGFNHAGLPVFSAIVTLEDWGLHTVQLKERLHTLVELALQDAGLPACMTVDHPYKVLSFFQLERHAQDIAKVGIANVFSPNAVYSNAAYRGCLFPETLAELMPDIAERAGFDRFQ